MIEISAKIAANFPQLRSVKHCLFVAQREAAVGTGANSL
jgi:hypothetical protein